MLLGPEISTAGPLDCSDLKRSFLRVGVHGANLKYGKLANAQGAKKFDPLFLNCKGKNCQIESRPLVSKFQGSKKEKGQTRVNLNEERAAFLSSATELEALANNGVCGAKSMRVQDGLVVKYTRGENVDSDIFLYSGKREIKSWMRTYRDGKTTVLKF
jgi:hypothetical protein